MYVSEKAIDLAMNKGYSVTLSPYKGVHMENGQRKIWNCSRGWQTANVVEGVYSNHVVFTSAIKALERPL